jgi:hypothetical protein
MTLRARAREDHLALLFQRVERRIGLGNGVTPWSIASTALARVHS